MSPTDDNTLNLAESRTSVNIPVTIKGLDSDAKAEIVLFEQNNEIGRTTVTSNGLVQIPVEGKALTTGEIRATITATDSVGNQATALATQSYTIDTTLNQPELTIQPLMGSNLITRKDIQNNALPVNLTLASLDSDAKATITLYNNDKKLGVAETNSNGDINLTINGADLVAPRLIAEIVVVDTAGNRLDFREETTLTINTAFPFPTLTFNHIAENGIINQVKSTTMQTVSLNVSNVESGTQTVITLKDGNQTLGEQTVTDNGDITFNVAGNHFTTGTLRAEFSTTLGLETQTGSPVTHNYTLDTQISAPTVEIVSVAGDNIITSEEQKGNVEIKANVGTFESDIKSALITYFDGTTELGSQTANAGENHFSVSAEKLTSGSVSAVIKVTDNVGNVAENRTTNSVYHIDVTTDKPTVEFVSIAGVAVTGETLATVIGSNQVKGETVPVVVKLAGLETNGSAQLTLTAGNKNYTESATKNDNVTFNVPKADFIGATQFSLSASARDQYKNPETKSDSVTVNYQSDFEISKPAVEILSIGGETNYQLYEHQVNSAKIPVSVQVSNIDSDARAMVELKINDKVIAHKENLSNQTVEFELTGDQLRHASELKVYVTAKDENGNQEQNETSKTYNVENFIQIKQIDADFNITYGDTRQAGVVISGEVELNAVLQDSWMHLAPNLNQGDVWRWVESVTIEFNNGTQFIVPVSHTDPDDDVFTEDPNTVHYALSLTASQWRDLGENPTFKVTPNRLSNRDGEVVKTFFYLNDGVNDNIFREDASGDGGLIQKLEIDVKQNFNEDISQNENSVYPYQLNTYNPKTFISGIAGGNDVQPGDLVVIEIGDVLYSTTLEADKSFYIEVPTEVLLDNPTTSVKASLTTKVGVPVEPAERGYLSSAITPQVSNNSGTSTDTQNNAQKAGNFNTVKDEAWDDLPYFIRALSYGEKLSGGYLYDHRSGAGITIKYSFADKTDPETLAYMKQYNSHPEIKVRHHYNIEGMTNFTEENKQVVRDALSKISERTKIVFEETNTFLKDGEGTNFFIFPFFNDKGVVPESSSHAGFASEGGNVRLNANLFQTQAEGSGDSIKPTNQGFTTVLHEMMHALGLKHPFIDQKEDDHSYNDQNIHDIHDIHSQDILSKAENRAMTTLMSYEFDVNSFGEDIRLFDLATLHYRYGVNSELRNGNDIYTFKTFNRRTIDGDIYIWDGSGVDTFNAANEEKPVYINLTPGSWIYRGNKLDTLIASDTESFAESDYFNDRNFTHKNPTLQDTFIHLYPTLKINEDQAFIGYGSIIENAVGSKFNDTLIGNDADNLLEGGEGNDILIGGKGNDVLNGGEGADRMEGGEGNDVYFVDHSRDQVIELQNQGKDTVYSSVSLFSVPQNVEIFHLLGNENLDINASTTSLEKTESGDSSMPNGNAVELYGNSGNNKLTGGLDNDILDGGEGADIMIGGKGDDIYYVDHVDDQVIELYGNGRDTVRISVESYTLDENIERVELLEGTKATNVKGSLKNGEYYIVTGNENDNRFDFDLVHTQSSLDISGNGGSNSYYMQFSEHLHFHDEGLKVSELRDLTFTKSDDGNGSIRGIVTDAGIGIYDIRIDLGHNLISADISDDLRQNENGDWYREFAILGIPNVENASIWGRSGKGEDYHLAELTFNTNGEAEFAYITHIVNTGGINIQLNDFDQSVDTLDFTLNKDLISGFDAWNYHDIIFNDMERRLELSYQENNGSEVNHYSFGLVSFGDESTINDYDALINSVRIV